ncbi:type I-E CRISPR-associated protein Cas6/Cse3/CasE [Bifidobacterium callitrichidarum]|uniref:Type I-E CRISPR-associated protein Cas6/Cse3/CasE n=1 Tax=Bifidobacterium callitrichidarum TaxID=2052941 RepID=A0A2U2NC19_9BIFI|nr:type I-E CRISPR-associated protein Cas6/Cse3/CasE [Bifidobacterium callitrichidarum]PWG66653.1 type I-E CRISPR-associated protein Cas6/Cse3/CasE [Bifidobacterium callitrichidarum]
MTYFTQMQLDPVDRRTRRGVASPERIHAILTTAIGSTGERILWRLDRMKTGMLLYMVSTTRPSRNILDAELGCRSFKICDYDEYLANIQRGTIWRFRLEANTTHKVDDKNIPLYGSDAVKWLDKRSQANGFHMTRNRLMDVEAVIVNDTTKVFQRKGRTVTLASSVYDGFISVDDPEKFTKMLKNGVGRAKGYGFGLMTVIPAQTSEQ